MIAKLLLCPVAQLADLELTHLVGQRLPGPGDVAVGFGLCKRLVDIVGAHIGDHLIAAPALVVHAGIDNQANGAEELGVEAAVVGDGVGVEADFLAQLFGIKRPAFGVGRVASAETELGKTL